MRYLFTKLQAARHKGDPIRAILSYWFPELISALILISLPPMIDSWIISRLGSTTIFGAVGMGTNFLHMLIKLAEAIPVAGIAMIGRHNGAKDYEQCGEGLADTFWTTFIIGFMQFLLIFCMASSIYHWLGVPHEMIAFGTPFLQLKSFGVFLIFIALSLLGFMRAVKNTQIPMCINIIGISLFIFFDYNLVLGYCGFPKLGLMGSAVSTIIQYTIMNSIALYYILTNPDYKKYFARLFLGTFNIARIGHLLSLSWPIMIDKMTIAASYVWLSKMIAPMGKYAIATFNVAKDLERFAFLPVIASAQIITFLVSNSLGAKDPDGASANIKKVFALTCITLVPALLILAFNAPFFISLFDPRGKITAFAGTVLPAISMLVFFDFTQVVLAGALRGAGDVKTVMWSRFFACTCFFVPVSYGLASIPGLAQTTRFVLVYGSFYITTGLMGITYLYRIKSHKWQNRQV